MLVVVASRHDRTAQQLVARWETDSAALLTAEDVCAPGWRHYVGSGEGSAVVDGAVVAVTDISGVLTRRPWVFEQELPHIAAADRAYVAAEMNALMVSWLSELPCPVLNQPTPMCLSGPSWRPQEWLRAAASSGLRVRPGRWEVPATGADRPDAGQWPGPVIDVTVVGGRCFGADGQPAARACQLAAAAGVELLGVRFGDGDGEPCFLSATTWPDVSPGVVADAVRDRLVGGRP